MTAGGGAAQGQNMAHVFSVDRANRTLPLIRRIVEDIVRYYGRWQQCVAEFEIATASDRADAPFGRADELQREAQSLAGDIQSFVAELHSLGVEFKGYDMGLVDFPGELDGRPVYWCWRLGEATVSYWHEVHTGFAGRRPLVPQLQD